MEMKLCKDCAYYRPYEHTPDDGDCRHPTLTWIHPVTGSPRYSSAFSSRMAGKCGRLGELWHYDPGSEPDLDEQVDMG